MKNWSGKHVSPFVLETGPGVLSLDAENRDGTYNISCVAAVPDYFDGRCPICVFSAPVIMLWSTREKSTFHGKTTGN